jgi:hypothetical protein
LLRLNFRSSLPALGIADASIALPSLLQT